MNSGTKKAVNNLGIILLLLCFGVLVSNDIKCQPTGFKKEVLQNFGTVIVPIELDTLMHSYLKEALIQTFLDSLSLKEKRNYEDSYKVELTKSFFSKSNGSAYLFFPSKTVFYLLDTTFSQLQNNDTSFSFDYNKIELLPKIVFKRDKTPYNSVDLKKFLSINKDTTKNYIQTLQQTMINLIRGSHPAMTIKNPNSSYYLLSNNFPVIKMKFDYSFNDGISISEATLVWYFIYKNFYTYIVNFEYRKEDADLWDVYIKRIMDQIILN